MNTIELLDTAGFDAFLAYLNQHLSDNGRGDALCCPADKAAQARN